MTPNLQIVVTILLYLAFFGWIGWRRGTYRELATLVVAGPAWYLLQNYGNIFVSIANLGGKFMAFLVSGGLGGAPEDAFKALGSAPDVVTRDTRSLFFFMLWVLVLVLTYILTNSFMTVESRDTASVILGMVNGVIFGAILLPRLLAPFVPNVDPDDFVAQTGFSDVMGMGREIFAGGLASLWVVMEPQSSIVLLLLITMLLLLAATSLRGGGRAEEG